MLIKLAEDERVKIYINGYNNVEQNLLKKGSDIVSVLGISYHLELPILRGVK